MSLEEQGRQRRSSGVRMRPPALKLKPMPKKDVAIRTPTIALILLPETKGPHSGEAEPMRSGPGSCAAVSPAKGVPSVAAIGDDACVWCPLAAICAWPHKNAIQADTPLRMAGELHTLARL